MAGTKKKKLDVLQMAEIGLADLLPVPVPVQKKKTKRQTPKELQDAIGTIGQNYMKLEDSINLALEVGRKHGFKDIEIGDMIRTELKRLGRSRMTVSRYLPATAKAKPRGNPGSHDNKISNKMLLNKSESGNKMLPNRPATIKVLPSDTTTSIQHEQPGRWNIDPRSYEIERLQEYDKDLLISIIEYLHQIRTNRIDTELSSEALPRIQ